MRLICLLFLLGAVVSSSAQRYKRIHSNAFIADTHNDVLMRSMEGLQIDSDLKGQTHTDISRLIQGNYGAQMFSVFFDERYGKDSAFRFAILDIDSLYAVVGRNSSRMMIVRNADELKLARRTHKLAALIGVEGGI
jgi:membrane dipeptidase